MNLTDKIKELFPVASTTRVVIDNLSEDNLSILQWLWDNKYIITVASDDINLLNKVNSKFINLSGSLGRWRVVLYSQALIEPCELYLMYKKANDAQISQIKAGKMLYTSDYKSC